jgi:predicted CoA-substrate-specific enzyme activase
MKTVGVCLGATTVSAVHIKIENSKVEILDNRQIPHEGDPKAILVDFLTSMGWEYDKIAFTGRKFKEFVNSATLTEPEAVEYALLNTLTEDNIPEAVVSAGGETIMVYLLDQNGRIRNVVTGNKCASGTGEFFKQQIKRMNLSIDEAVDKAMEGDPYHVSGRCSVFCKSDCTHALNKGVPIENVSAGLSKMVASKIHELTSKNKIESILFTGGMSKNRAVLKYLEEYVSSISVPESAPYFEALGSAIWAEQNGAETIKDVNSIFHEGKTSFTFLDPLKKYESMVTFKETNRITPADGDECIIGLDVGSTTTKAVLIRTEDDGIAASIYLRTDGNPIKASRACYAALKEQLNGINVNIIGLGVTGSGRQIAGLHALTDGVINEIIAHARAATYYDEDVDTIFEIGGQDAKYTYITNSVPSDYAMNEACSAGTGSFLEEAAYESLGIDVKDIGDIAMTSETPPNFNDQCAAFISSDIKTAFQEGISKQDVVGGLVYSICLNYVNRVKGNRQVGKKIFMQGGVCYNKAVPVAMAALVDKEIIVPPEPGLMGSYGVALEVKSQIEKGFLEKKEFVLDTLINREVEYDKAFTCAGGKEKCDLGCSINRIRIEGKVYPFGGACNKYINLRRNINVDANEFDLSRYRQHILFNDFFPDQTRLDNSALKIGLNRTFHSHLILPLYSHFFDQLGMKVVLSDTMLQEGVDRKTTSFCFPCEISLGLFEDLLNKGVDHIFMPHIEEMFVNHKDNVRKEFHSTCIFVQGESFFLQEAFRDRQDDFIGKFITPTINFAEGYEKEIEIFAELAEQLGKTKQEGRSAFRFAMKKQQEFVDATKVAAQKVLEKIESDPNNFGVVLLGRPYNSFAKEANKGIPTKFASRGIYLIPFDMLPWEDMPEDDEMFWEMGHRIIKAVHFVKNHPQLFGTYIMNFLCAIDSILITKYRDLMGTKPSLTLELDGHTADAGVNTRIEAFLDIVRNYRRIKHSIQEKDYAHYVESRLEMESGKMVFYNSRNERKLLTDTDVTLLIPNMGDASSRLLASVFRKEGINAIATPVSDTDVLKYGRANTTGKECMPMHLVIGSLLKYVYHKRKPGENIVLFMPAAAGYCRMGQYRIFIRSMLKKLDIRDVAQLSLENENSYAGLGPRFTMTAWQSVVTGDVLKDIKNSIRAMAKDKEYGLQIYEEELQKMVTAFEKGNIYKQLKKSAQRFADIPRKFEIDEAHYIAIMGEIFVRRDGFSRQGLVERLSNEGFVVRISPLMEWVYYMDYLIHHGMFEASNKWADRFERWISGLVQKNVEKKIKKIFLESKLFEYSEIDLETMLAHSTHVLPKTLKGEPGMMVGMAMHESIDKFAGIISIGPFGCMPVRYTESILTQQMTVKGKKEGMKNAGHDDHAHLEHFEDEETLPYLTIESDGNPYPQVINARIETFILQAKRMGERIQTHIEK